METCRKQIDGEPFVCFFCLRSVCKADCLQKSVVGKRSISGIKNRDVVLHVVLCYTD